MYQVKLQQFAGPFELLVELIEKKELSINQVSLAEVADQYLNHLKEANKFPLEEVVYFIVIASTLMLIKSRSLLPSLKLTEEEETEIYDLESRLKLYEEYRTLAKELERIFGKKVIFEREPFLQVQEVFIEPKGLTVSKLQEVLEHLLSALPQKEILPQALVKKTITLEQKITELTERFQEKITLCFSDIKKSGCDKVEIIVSFLALLELMKRGILTASQNQLLGEIEINKIQKQ